MLFSEGILYGGDEGSTSDSGESDDDSDLSEGSCNCHILRNGYNSKCHQIDYKLCDYEQFKNSTQPCKPEDRSQQKSQHANIVVSR